MSTFTMPPSTWVNDPPVGPGARQDAPFPDRTRAPRAGTVRDLGRFPSGAHPSRGWPTDRKSAADLLAVGPGVGTCVGARLSFQADSCRGRSGGEADDAPGCGNGSVDV